MAAAEKRPASNVFASSQQMVVKRQKSDASLHASSSAVARTSSASANGALVPRDTRTSGLSAPLTALSGHAGEVFAARFDPAGQLIASGSMDQSILLWRVYGACENYGVLKGHGGAVLDLRWGRDSETLYSASADKALASWDVHTGRRLRRHVGHAEVVNAVDVTRRGAETLVSGSDDGYVAVWDARAKQAAAWLGQPGDMPVAAVAVGEAGGEVWAGGIDNVVRAWDVRAMKVLYELRGHADTVTSLALAPGPDARLLSNSHDGTARVWDVKPYVAGEQRLVRTFDGAPPGPERNLIRASWDARGERIAAGSGDGSVLVWDARTGKMLYKLPGHKGTVNDAQFTPREDEPIRKFSSLVLSSFDLGLQSIITLSHRY
jgi:Prp8 binding protein